MEIWPLGAKTFHVSISTGTMRFLRKGKEKLNLRNGVLAHTAQEWEVIGHVVPSRG